MRVSSKAIKTLVTLALALFVWSCASYLKYGDEDRLASDSEFEKQVEIKDIPAPPAQETPAPPPASQEVKTPTPQAPSKPEVKVESQKVEPSKVEAKPPAKTPVKKGKKGVKKDEMLEPEKRQPEIEDSENFVGRRPAKDPFRVGERVTLAVRYFKVAAGYMTMETRPFKEVNGRKSYHYYISVKSSSVFNMFYAVDDWAETFVDFETLTPSSFSIDAKETGQLRNHKMYIDAKTNKAKMWEKKYTKKKGHQEKKLEWMTKPFSQNVLSAAYYLRNFTLTPGKKLQFYVADEGKNILFRGEVLRRERISTKVGELDTVVVRPQFEIDGVFKQTGENLLWLTDDDRKLIVRIESKIKIGTLVCDLESIELGQN